MSPRNTLFAIISAAALGAGGAVGLGTLLGDQQSSPKYFAWQNRVAKLESRLEQQQKTIEELLQVIGVGIGNPQQRPAEISDNIEPQANENTYSVPIEAGNNPLLEDFNQANTESLSRSEYRKQTLIAGGFADDEANWVLDNESQVELEQLYSQHKLQREAFNEDTVESRAWLQRQFRTNRLREKLGDDYYQRYLEANGWPTSAEINTIVKGSPADKFGLKPGDRITAYAGEKVFNMRDVSRLTLQGEEGENILLEVERDGSPIQITIPRGPVGVSSANNRFGR